jgi:hypothetical protein
MSRSSRFDYIRGGIEVGCASNASARTLGYVVRVGLIIERVKQRAKKPAFCDEKLFDVRG